MVRWVVLLALWVLMLPVSAESLVRRPPAGAADAVITWPADIPRWALVTSATEQLVVHLGTRVIVARGPLSSSGALPSAEDALTPFPFQRLLDKRVMLDETGDTSLPVRWLRRPPGAERNGFWGPPPSLPEVLNQRHALHEHLGALLEAIASAEVVIQHHRNAIDRASTALMGGLETISATSGQVARSGVDTESALDIFQAQYHLLTAYTADIPRHLEELRQQAAALGELSQAMQVLAADMAAYDVALALLRGGAVVDGDGRILP